MSCYFSERGMMELNSITLTALHNAQYCNKWAEKILFFKPARSLSSCIKLFLPFKETFCRRNRRFCQINYLNITIKFAPHKEKRNKCFRQNKVKIMEIVIPFVGRVLSNILLTIKTENVLIHFKR